MALEVVATSTEPMTIDAVASALAVHRSIAYRLLRTLEARNLIGRDQGGRYRAGSGLAALARSVQIDLRCAAAPELRRLSNSLAMTAFVVVRDGDEAVTVESVAPALADAHVVYRPGSRHPVERGAPGLALLMGAPSASGSGSRERVELRRARARGWARTTGEVLPGMASIAAPIGTHAAVAVLWLAGQSVDEDRVAAEVLRAADAIAAAIP